jgi:hypothetical protein
LFLLRDGALTLIEQPPGAGPFGPAFELYNRATVSAIGDVWAINRLFNGGCPPASCLSLEAASTTIQTGGAKLTFAANTALSANGRFAALYGNTNQSPGANPPAHSVQLLDLQSGQIRFIGPRRLSQGALSPMTERF